MKRITLYSMISFATLLGNAQMIYIDENFDDTDTSAGTVVLASGFAKYNYTADINGGIENWAATPTTSDKTNSISMHSRSGSAAFTAASFSGNNVLRITGGANYLTADAGIYFTGLDLTAKASLTFEFEIWGAPVAGDTDIPATHQGWSINFNFGNSDTAFDLLDSYFASGANVINNVPFSITNLSTMATSTNQTSFDILDGVWLKVTGTVDLTGLTLGSFAALQIHTDSGGFVSGGVPIYAIDNVKVSAQSVPLSTDSFELDNSIAVYPNPVSNLLTIKNSNNIAVKDVRLMNALGKVVYSSKDVKPIDMSGYAKGLYILSFTSDENITLNKKIVVK